MNSHVPNFDSSVPGPASAGSPAEATAWHEAFLAMLPKIQDHASYRFRHLKGDRRDEAIHEVVCNCCVAYARLVEQGRAEAATWSSLAKYAVAQVLDGRRVGTSLNVKDVTSAYCQKRKGAEVRNIHRWDEQEQEWHEMVLEDRRANPADLAAFRIDFREFLRSLSRRDRQIAIHLAKQHATSWVAKKFRVSASRISQLRRELYEAWHRFHGEAPEEDSPAVLSAT